MDHLVPSLTLGVGHDGRSAAHQQREESEAVRVISYYQEIQRPRQFHRLAGVGSHLFALGKAIGVTGVQPGTGSAGVHRIGGMQVRIAE